MMKKLALVYVVLGSLFLQAADLRVWTSRQGSTIEAELSKVDGESVVLLTSEPKEIKLKIADLSLADRQYLVEHADQSEEIFNSEKLAVPEEEVRIDKKEFKKLEDLMTFEEDSALSFDLMETEHFLIATEGRVRPDAVAEMAERLWYGMAFQHMNFREDWGDQKMVFFLVEDEDLYEAMGDWYVSYLEEQGNEDAALKTEQLWDKVASAGFQVPQDVQDSYNTFAKARVFRVRDSTEKSFKKVFGPMPTNMIASTLLAKQMGGRNAKSPNGHYVLLTGYAYYKEIQLADRSETSMLSAGDYDNDEIASSRGFADGTSWAKSLRKLVKKDEVDLDLQAMLFWQNTALTPKQMVVMYSFGYYLNSNSDRICRFAKLVQQTQSDKKVPAAIEIAEILGFGSVEELQEDWKEFVLSRDFK